MYTLRIQYTSNQIKTNAYYTHYIYNYTGETFHNYIIISIVKVNFG